MDCRDRRWISLWTWHWRDLNWELGSHRCAGTGATTESRRWLPEVNPASRSPWRPKRATPQPVRKAIFRSPTQGFSLKATQKVKTASHKSLGALFNFTSAAVYRFGHSPLLPLNLILLPFFYYSRRTKRHLLIGISTYLAGALLKKWKMPKQLTRLMFQRHVDILRLDRFKNKIIICLLRVQHHLSTVTGNCC